VKYKFTKKGPDPWDFSPVAWPFFINLPLATWVALFSEIIKYCQGPDPY